jgi:Zn-dependent peptidase ImmA (M78 family)/DNA-binding XRE family transcriptional regulator
MFVPERLTLARERRGLKKSELARLVGKVPRTIADYETGRTQPSDELVQKFADELSFPQEFFFRELRESMTRHAASFRSLSRMTATQAMTATAVGTLGIELNAWIEEHFHLPEPTVPDLQPGIIDPEGAAALVRAQWGLGEAPVSNMLDLLELHGVRICSLADECREVDAFSAWIAGTPYMCLATYKTAERAIFDAAHELGHLVLHRDHASPRGRTEEREADAFASSFLMPKADIQAEAPYNPTLADIIHAKHRWRVSTAALAYRMHKLGLISDWHYREMCIELSHYGRHREPLPLERERSQLLLKVFSTMRAEGVTRDGIAEKLAIYPADLDSLTFGLAMSVLEGGGDDEAPRRGHLRLV